MWLTIGLAVYFSKCSVTKTQNILYGTVCGVIVLKIAYIILLDKPTGERVIYT